MKTDKSKSKSKNKRKASKLQENVLQSLRASVAQRTGQVLHGAKKETSSGIASGHDEENGQKPATIEDNVVGDPMLSTTRILRDWNNAALRSLWNKNYQPKLPAPRAMPQLSRANGLEPRDLKRCIAIVQLTSRAAYEASSMGWNFLSKSNEMSDPNMIYILLSTHSQVFKFSAPNDPFGDLLGFISFKVEYDDPPHDDRQVLYIYELHISQSWRACGLGKALVFTVQQIAKNIGINKIMLTVFNSNKCAIVAYEKMGFVKDEASPKDRVVRNRTIQADYRIMSITQAPHDGGHMLTHKSGFAESVGGDEATEESKE